MDDNTDDNTDVVDMIIESNYTEFCFNVDHSMNREQKEHFHKCFDSLDVIDNFLSIIHFHFCKECYSFNVR